MQRTLAVVVEQSPSPTLTPGGEMGDVATTHSSWSREADWKRSATVSPIGVLEWINSSCLSDC